VIGSPGAAPGELESPRGLALDGDGDLLVADSGNNRIQKLSPDGHPLAVWGGPNPGDGPRQFRQPCGVAAARDGSIYVADTWNHRIQKLDGDGRYVLEWRERNPGFWGPRAVAVAPDGTVFVADTGNKRILAYDPNGRSLFAFGGEGVEPGQLVEPVGLAIDPEGQVLYVADTGNHRVQAFGLDGTPRYAWPAYGWQEFYTEPYLAWQGGTLWATDSFNHRVNGYGPLGRLRSSIGGLRSTPFGRPIGIAAAPDGRLYVTDFAQDHIVAAPIDPRGAQRRLNCFLHPLQSTQG
jgi:DNA-binding beta-propeller fold protein YncE